MGVTKNILLAHQKQNFQFHYAVVKQKLFGTYKNQIAF